MISYSLTYVPNLIFAHQWTSILWHFIGFLNYKIFYIVFFNVQVYFSKLWFLEDMDFVLVDIVSSRPHTEEVFNFSWECRKMERERGIEREIKGRKNGYEGRRAGQKSGKRKEGRKERNRKEFLRKT